VQNQRLIDSLLATEPPRDYAVNQVLRCWADMSTERAIGMAEGPIPWRAIRDWCEFHFGDDRDAAQLMITVIRKLDDDRARAQAAEMTQRQALGPGAARGRT
jgi:hypothetical protein